MTAASAYDVAVIGAGISGLTAGALLSAQGKRVLVLEKQAEVGGYYSAFRHGDALFETAVSYTLSCGPGDVVHRLLQSLGLAENLQFQRLETVDRAYFPDLTLQVRSGREAFTASLCKQFPGSRAEIERLVEWLNLFQVGVAASPGTGGAGNAEAMKLLMKNYLRTYEEFLDDMVSDERLRAYLALRIQADPASLMIMAGFVAECYLKGMYFLPGGTQQLPLALAEYIRQHGGSILTGAEVVNLEVEGRAVTRIHTADEREFQARFVVANCDVHRLTKQMLSEPPPAEYLKAMDRRKVGHSSLSLYLTAEGLNLDHLKGGRIYLSHSYDLFGVYRQLESGAIPADPVIKIHIPSLNDPSLAGPGQHVIRIETDLYLEQGAQEPEAQYAEVLPARLLQQVEDSVIRGLRSHITFMKVTTPRQFEALYLHTQGSGTGWAHTVANSVQNPFKQSTPYENLVLAGQWGEFSSGLRQLVLSGQKAASLVEKLSDRR